MQTEQTRTVEKAQVEEMKDGLVGNSDGDGVAGFVVAESHVDDDGKAC